MATPPRRTFERRDRLGRSRDFTRVYAQGTRVASRTFLMFLAENTLGHHRLGLAIPRRVGNAVLRNRVKRRLREAFRLSRHRIAGSLDLVLHGRSEVATQPMPELREALVATAQRGARQLKAKSARAGTTARASERKTT